ncbi:hypothetical protein LCGC14_1284290 [marine sediment metagenome]|uniref:Uncharacterized protein n=1 Tax=marine sediment metagenome TaxID=412755 RepID=A0A0F9NAY0_9ZZZZ
MATTDQIARMKAGTEGAKKGRMLPGSEHRKPHRWSIGCDDKCRAVSKGSKYG